ncbi:MAG: hypothetical protein GWP06_17950 [Actinobacteria bacterium]|nr:hypothetical protein [Actinomycetota bacterium]
MFKLSFASQRLGGKNRTNFHQTPRFLKRAVQNAKLGIPEKINYFILKIKGWFL